MRRFRDRDFAASKTITVDSDRHADESSATVRNIFDEVRR
jgi:hypothetical protein